MATLDELKCLPGIGEKISRKLIAERQEKSFDSYMDVINRVDGITHFKINTWINHKMVDLSLNEKLFFKKCMQHLCQTKVIISLIALFLFVWFWIYVFVQCQTNVHGVSTTINGRQKYHVQGSIVMQKRQKDNIFCLFFILQII